MLLQVINGTTREGRFSERVAAWVMGRLEQHPAFEVELVDLRDHPLPFFDADSPAKTGRDYTDEAVVRFSRVIDRADGYVILTAEYNHGYPAVLKNALDSTFVEWRRKPVAYVGWGNTGGARAIEQLRAVAVEFEMAPLRHAVHILGSVMLPAMTAEEFSPSLFESLDERLEMLIKDLVWWATALKIARDAG